MTIDEKLAAILAAVQTDPGNRGLARDPHDNLFTATEGDFQAACRRIVDHPRKVLVVGTGFYIPSADPPAFETDGPLGAVFLTRALNPLGYTISILGEHPVDQACFAIVERPELDKDIRTHPSALVIVIERGGPGADGLCRTMRGANITPQLFAINAFLQYLNPDIGIGDGGNEMGMGRIPHETIVKNIPNGDVIHCRVSSSQLIVAGVSNWGAYALAAGIYVLRGMTPSRDLFDPDREREILEVMVREGPLVDGVTGKQTATVDGLSWADYTKPLVRIREILES